MSGRGALAAPTSMPEHDDDIIEKLTERVERRLSDECGKLRVEDANLRADMNRGFGELRTENAHLRADLNKGFGELRAEMIERNAELLKWGLAFWTTQIGVVAALLALMR